jgi:hypothetical protein
MPPQSLHVRYREQSGRHLLAASISPFDPFRNLATLEDISFGLVPDVFQVSSLDSYTASVEPVEAVIE